MALALLTQIARPYLAPAFSPRREQNPSVGGTLFVVAMVGAAAYAAHRIFGSDASAGPTVTPGTDEPGPTPDPTQVEFMAVDVGLHLNDGPDPIPHFANLMLGPSADAELKGAGSRLNIASATPVDVDVNLVTPPGAVIESSTGQYRAAIRDISIASSTKLVGAEVIAGKYGMSPSMTFRIYEPTPNAPAILLQVQYSWYTQTGAVKSDTLALGIFATGLVVA